MKALQLLIVSCGRDAACKEGETRQDSEEHPAAKGQERRLTDPRGVTSKTPDFFTKGLRPARRP